MNKIRDYSSYAATLLLGALGYVGLNWIPIVGPLGVGLIVGYVRRKGPRDGFQVGVYSGLIGAVTVVYLFYETKVLSLSGISTFPSFLIVWIMVLWNLVGVFFTGVGGALASMFFHAHDFIEKRLDHGLDTRRMREHVTSFIICERCGESMQENAGECPHCKMEIT